MTTAQTKWDNNIVKFSAQLLCACGYEAVAKELLQSENEKTMTFEDDDVRYWIDVNPTKKPFGEATVGICDEKAGGIIAYLSSVKLARKFIEDCIESDED